MIQQTFHKRFIFSKKCFYKWTQEKTIPLSVSFLPKSTNKQYTNGIRNHDNLLGNGEDMTSKTIMRDFLGSGVFKLRIPPCSRFGTNKGGFLIKYSKKFRPSAD